MEIQPQLDYKNFRKNKLKRAPTLCFFFMNRRLVNEEKWGIRWEKINEEMMNEYSG